MAAGADEQEQPTIKDDFNRRLSDREDELADSLPSIDERLGGGLTTDEDQLIEEGGGGRGGSGGGRRRLSQDIEDHVTRPLRRLLAGSRESLGSRGEPLSDRGPLRKTADDPSVTRSSEPRDADSCSAVTNDVASASTNRSQAFDSTNSGSASVCSRQIIESIRV